MKIFLVILIFTFNLFACSGDCMSCHPSLKNSINQEHHKILTSCISCHTKTPATMVECGGDCFSCHSQNKLILSNRVEHKNLSACKTCHINKEDLFKTPGINQGSTLIDLLNNK